MEAIWLVPLFPLIGVLLNGFLGPRAGRRFVSVIGPGVVLLSFLAAVSVLMSLLGQAPDQRSRDVTLYHWITAPSNNGPTLDVPFAFRIDPLSVTMMLVVTGVGFLIHVYSTGYMADDPRYARFFTYLNLFTFSMLLLVLANNYVLMFVGWEGVGLCSYLLIGYYFNKVSAAAAGKKAFIVNRVGDWGFLLGMLLLFWELGTLTFGGVPGVTGVFDRIAEKAATAEGTATLTTAALLLFLGAAGKSAMLPLYLWLPDAMEGPTPVSALIHAATMVTAGVYMVARSHALYSAAPDAMLVVAAIGVITALFAASVAIVQNDIKRVLAYSTVSQLGYMFLGVGVGAYAAGIFHLVTHAFFKALLFLAAGSVMHSLAGQLDMRKMGGLARHMRITYATFLVGWWAICGLPPFAGFYSKDAILASAAGSHHIWLFWLGLFTAGLTAFYMSRMFFTTFWGPERIELGDEHHGGHGDEEHGHDDAHAHAHAHGHAHPSHTHVHADGHVHVHESPPSMTVPLIVLALGSAAAGFLLNSILPGWLEPAVGPAVEHAEGGMSHGQVAIFSIVAAVIGIAVAGVMFTSGLFVKGKRTVIGDLLEARFGYDALLYFLFVQVGGALAQFFWRVVDAGLIDGIVNGVGVTVNGGARALRTLQTGYVRNYALVMLVGATVVVGAFIWWLK